MIRIILVDDSAVARRWLSQSLSAEDDIEIIAQGSTGKEAVELVIAHSPDLLVMDMAMPEMDGIEATRLIMERQPTAIIMLSAQVNRPEGMDVLQGVGEGALQVVEKPTSQKDLESWKEKLLKTIRAAASSAEVRELHLQSKAREEV